MGTQALILAAGRGSRLGSRSEGMPKPLLEVGRKTLVEHQLETLSEAGIGPVAMVVGYAADEIQTALGMKVEYLHNSRWATTNSLHSFSLAREWVTGDLVILNCDVLFDPEILDRLLERGGNCLAYDSSSGNGREHMKVCLRAGRIVGISKTLDPAASNGENVGILHLQKDCVDALFQAADELLAEGQEQAWFGAAVQRVAQARAIDGVDVAGLPWGEIDFSYDLDRARREVLPAIRRRNFRKRPVIRVGRLILLAAAVVLSIGYMIRSLTPPTPEWETLALSGLDHCRIEVRDIPQDWYVLAGGRSELETSLAGPSEVLIETRFILLHDADRESHYVLVTVLDDDAEQWHAIATRPSGSVHHGEWVVAKNDRERIEVPAGRHRLRARLEVPSDGRCLVRIRQLVRNVDN